MGKVLELQKGERDAGIVEGMSWTKKEQRIGFAPRQLLQETGSRDGEIGLRARVV